MGIVFTIICCVMIFLATAYMEWFVGEYVSSEEEFYKSGVWVAVLGGLALDVTVLLSPFWDMILKYFGERPEAYETMSQAALRGGAMTLGFIFMFFMGIMLYIGFEVFDKRSASTPEHDDDI